MRFRACIAIAALLLAAAPARAERTFEQAARQERPKQQFVTLTTENDLYGAGTDRNYTNGLRLGWLDTSKKPPKFTKFFREHLPFFSVNETTAVYYSLGHNLYTPRDISTPVPNPKDHPYAAFLYGSVGMTTAVENHLDSMELTLGVVGPAALGEDIQKFVHRIVNSPQPHGWDYQLKNEPGLMVSTQRLWPEAASKEFGPLHFRTSPYIGGTLGNVYTYANAGMIFQLVPRAYKWQGLPLRVRPAMPGSGYFSAPDDSFSWSLFAGIEGRAVARNIFLDGNTFADSPSVDKKYFVGDANIGVATAYSHTQISYTLNWRSEEFRDQDKSDLFGAISLSYRF